jgi:uncharacterized membrane protein
MQNKAKSRFSTSEICYAGLMISAVFVATRWIQIPVPATAGYIHPGDAFILLASFVFGPVIGAIAGGFGSALADWTSGYAVYAPWTLVIKATMGYVAGIIAQSEWAGGGEGDDQSSAGHQKRGAAEGHGIRYHLPMLAGCFFGVLVMVSGYFFAEAAMFSNFRTPLAALPMNLFQGFMGAALAFPTAIKLRSAMVSRGFRSGRGLVLLLICMVALTASGCGDKRDIKEAADFFKANMNVKSVRLRGELAHIEISQGEASISLVIRRFKDSTAASKFYEDSTNLNKRPFIRRSGVWVAYTENWNNKNFLENEEAVDSVESVFYKW